MSRCEHCPLGQGKGPCPSASWPAYCDWSRVEAGSPGHWTRRLLAEAGRPAPPTPPSLIAKVGSFAVAVARHVLDGGRLASAGVQAERERKCLGCEAWHDHAADACRHCGCGQDPAVVAVGIDMKLKRSWASSRCPIGEWGPE